MHIVETYLIYIKFIFYKIILLFIVVVILSSCNNAVIVDAKIEQVHTKPWPRSGNILYYTITYNRGAKVDTALLFGNGIYQKNSGLGVILQPGDSVKIKTRGQERINSKHIISFTRKDWQHRRVVPPADNRNALRTISHLDTIPLLPGSSSLEDNKRILAHFFGEKIAKRNIRMGDTCEVDFWIDTLGNSYIQHIKTNDSVVIDIIERNFHRLPKFTPGISSAQKVNVTTSFTIVPYELK